MENNYKELQRADSKELMGKPKYKKKETKTGLRKETEDSCTKTINIDQLLLRLT